jgi:hypothetical protein
MFKDPVCNMMVVGKKAKFISEVGERKVVTGAMYGTG